MIEASSQPAGGIRIEINGQTEELPADKASAFISVMLHKMQQKAAELGDNTPTGGAILYPDAVSVETDKQSGEQRLRLGFGKALFVISMPPGMLKNVDKAIEEI
ncbi:hypothetical protein [Rhizobium sp. NFR03]|uniref:hypothetical protein n=1 Tax=Rhizobium sp. NFR03 TaxID=1566263 RepID=UPI0008C40E00|nr:hypothetical protein [Rhizobium sp. NFR03]SER57711.1 hypothetical protein SAMN03159406_00543 [Rhizobium sp. NFR03]